MFDWWKFNETTKTIINFAIFQKHLFVFIVLLLSHGELKRNILTKYIYIYDNYNLTIYFEEVIFLIWTRILTKFKIYVIIF